MSDLKTVNAACRAQYPDSMRMLLGLYDGTSSYYKSEAARDRIVATGLALVIDAGSWTLALTDLGRETAAYFRSHTPKQIFEDAAHIAGYGVG